MIFAVAIAISAPFGESSKTAVMAVFDNVTTDAVSVSKAALGRYTGVSADPRRLKFEISLKSRLIRLAAKFLEPYRKRPTRGTRRAREKKKKKVLPSLTRCRTVGVAARVFGAPNADGSPNMATSRLPFSHPHRSPPKGERCCLSTAFARRRTSTTLPMHIFSSAYTPSIISLPFYSFTPIIVRRNLV